MAKFGPMGHDHRTAIERWLESGAPDTASMELEAAWTRLLSELPDESPGAEFAGRVMLRVAGLAHPRLGWGGLRAPRSTSW